MRCLDFTALRFAGLLLLFLLRETSEGGREGWQTYANSIKKTKKRKKRKKKGCVALFSLPPNSFLGNLVVVVQTSKECVTL